ncbi:MAG: outer membrane protein [Beijerinckiaceae bacterium]|nr:MAG: outer membrane protein [Beijerinckiaceae bacterium]
MKKLSIVAGLGAAVLATGAFAADLPRKSAPVAPAYARAPIFTWTGFYVGVNAGYGFGGMTGPGSGIFKDPSGFIGGGQVGYNYQINQVVVGLETDLQYSGISGKSAAVGSKGSIPYFGTVRARAGVAMDRFLPYITAGYAYGGTDLTVPGASTKTMHHGYVIGGGVEYAFTNNITAKVEGLYMDLGEKSVLGATRKIGFEGGVVRAGVNYKF